MLTQRDLGDMWLTIAAHPWVSTLLLVAFIVLLWVANLYKDALDDADAEQHGK